MKKAIYFTLDALFATILIGFGLVLITQNFISETEHPQINYYSQDIIASLSTIKISELDDPYVQSLISSGEIINLNNTIIEQIGEFYVLNKTDLAQDLAIIVSDNLIPAKFGVEILVNNDSIYLNGSSENSELVSSRRLISGIEKFKPIRGATSKVFLESIRKKKYSSYLYFGGFVGQGNITGFIDDLPEDINITNVYMELDSGDDLSLYINNILCEDNLTAGSGSMTADAYDLSYCNDSIIPDSKNNFTLVFDQDLNNAYVGGGFIRVDYYTDELYQEPGEYIHYEYLPEIQGIVNLYSSFYVPGDLNNISVYLHYYVKAFNETNNTFYLTIGNSTVYRDFNLTGEKNHTITLENITKHILLSYLNRKTVPIRAGFENVSFGYIYEGNADVALVTDVSGSMDDEMGSSNTGDMVNCDDSDINESTASRLSVAKCLDKEFSRSILNISGNQVGLISYDTSTDTGDTVYPTTSISLLDSTIGTSSPETGYSGGSYTCICCGINSAKDILVENITRTVFINAKSTWNYNDFNLNTIPPVDEEGNQWYSFKYMNETEWSSGNTILGSTNAYVYSPNIDTEISSSLTSGSSFVNLSELEADTTSPEVDFSSGLYQTANTWGTAGNMDGWDSNYGIFGRSGSDIKINFDPNENGNQGDNTVATQRYIRILAGDDVEDSNSDCTGAAAVGVELEITSEMYDILNTLTGTSSLSFYWYVDRYGGIDNGEAAWIKAQFGQDGSMTYLGADLDNTNNPNDGDNEVYYCENDQGTYACPGLIYNTSSFDISSLITAPGSYYLILGAVFDEAGDTNCDEDFEFRFDDILLTIRNETDNYYFRKNFTVSDLDLVEKGILNVLSDDSATVYLNGEQIYADSDSHEADVWNTGGKLISQSRFYQGNNVIAVKVSNADDATKFDLELAGLDDSREKAMMVMTDGQANYECSPHQYSTTQALIDAVDSACNATATYGITIYSVGYSNEAYEDTLQEIAECGNGIYVKSDNTTILSEFYQDVASTIVSASRHSQTIEVKGNITSSILYGDSYVRLGYSPIASSGEFGEISIIVEEKNFDNCSFEVDIPADIRVSDAKLTSYSSEHWTDALFVNGNEVYNLSKYSEDYGPMGDPFLLNIPVDLLQAGTNTFFVRTGDSPENYTECSLNNTLIYTSQFSASVSYSDVLEKAEGCTWQVEFEDGGSAIIDVPQYYTGSKTCFYTNATYDLDDTYDKNDTYDDAMYNLLSNLDFDKDGRIYVNINEENFVIGAISVGKIPYPWGPAIAEVRVWK